MNIVTKMGSYTADVRLGLVVVSLRRLGLGAALLLLAGCSALNIGEEDYSCPGKPNGVKCMSAREVYSATNDGNVPRPMKPDEVKVQVDSGSGGKTVIEATNSTSSGDAIIDTYVAPRLPDRPIPIRTPAQVMRIWVAPWEDTNGDLIVTGYIYTEIEPRRWVIGNDAPQNEPVLRPLQSVRYEPKTEATITK